MKLDSIARLGWLSRAAWVLVGLGCFSMGCGDSSGTAGTGGEGAGNPECPYEVLDENSEPCPCSTFTFVGGPAVCTVECQEDAECGPGTGCSVFIEPPGLCLPRCDDGTPCDPGFGCQEPGDTREGFCLAEPSTGS